MKVLAKLGLVTAAAATVLFIFIYEFQGPVINRVMSEAAVSPAPEEIITPQVNTETPEINPQTQPALEASVDASEPLDEPVIDEDIKQPEEVVEEPVSSDEVETVTAPPETVEVVKPTGPTRRIYGKITLSTTGEQLGGVNIMVPGSNVAKISNPNGGYTIEIPERTRELVFIYRGKKLTQRLSSDNSLLNVTLNLATMRYD